MFGKAAEFWWDRKQKIERALRATKLEEIERKRKRAKGKNDRRENRPKEDREKDDFHGEQ